MFSATFYSVFHNMLWFSGCAFSIDVADQTVALLKDMLKNGGEPFHAAPDLIRGLKGQA